MATPSPVATQAPAAPGGPSGPSILFLVLLAITIAAVFIVGAIWYVGRQERTPSNRAESVSKQARRSHATDP